MRSFRTFWIEVKQRGILSAVVVYAVAGFGILLLTDSLALVLAFPVWLHRLLIKTLIAGFAITVAVAWIFDVRREVQPIGGRDLDAIEDAERNHSAALLKMAAIVVVAVAFIALVGVVFTERSNSPDVVESRIAVIDFENRTENPSLDGLGPEAADWITQRLMQGRQVDVVPFTSSLAFAAATRLSRAMAGYDRAVRIARGVGAGLLVWGSYYIDGDSLRFSAELIDSRTGNLVRAIPTTSVSVASPLGGVALLRENVTRAIAQQQTVQAGTWSPAFAPPPAPQAYQHFARGVTALAQQDVPSAIESFADAIALDTTFVLARVWQARALGELGRFHETDSLVVLLSRQRSRLIAYDQHLLDYVSAHAQSRRDDEYAAATAMQSAAPASDDAARLVAVAALAMSYPRQARSTLLQLHADHGWLKGWQGYYANLALAYHVLEDYRDEMRVARQGLAAFPASAEVWLALCRASSALRRFDDVRLMRAIPQSASYHAQMTPGTAFYYCAQHLAAKGDSEASRAYINRAYGWFASMADTAVPALSRADYANVLVLHGRQDESFALMQRLVRENRDAEIASLLEAKLATIAALTGRRAEAARIDAQLDTLPEAVASPLILLERARTATVLGEIDRGWSLLGSALQDGLPYASTQTVLPTADIFIQRLRANPGFRTLFRPRG